MPPAACPCSQEHAQRRRGNSQRRFEHGGLSRRARAHTSTRTHLTHGPASAAAMQHPTTRVAVFTVTRFPNKNCGGDRWTPARTERGHDRRVCVPQCQNAFLTSIMSRDSGASPRDPTSSADAIARFRKQFLGSSLSLQYSPPLHIVRGRGWCACKQPCAAFRFTLVTHSAGRRIPVRRAGSAVPGLRE